MSSSSSSPQSTQVNAPPVSANLTTLGLGYAIAVSFAFLLLLSTVLIASYFCCRRSSSSSSPHHSTTASSPSPNSSAIVSRFVFIDDDDDEEEDNGANIIVGLDRAVINSYPKFPFSKSTSRSDSNSESSCCSICLCEFREEEMLRMMPDCKHFFHLQCLDAWLRLNGSCPVCRNSPLPTPVSTPLAEVVPLAQYSADRSRSRTTRSSSFD